MTGSSEPSQPQPPVSTSITQSSNAENLHIPYMSERRDESHLIAPQQLRILTDVESLFEHSGDEQNVQPKPSVSGISCTVFLPRDCDVSMHLLDLSKCNTELLILPFFVCLEDLWQATIEKGDVFVKD